MRGSSLTDPTPRTAHGAARGRALIPVNPPPPDCGDMGYLGTERTMRVTPFDAAGEATAA